MKIPELKPIKTNGEYKQTLGWVDEQFDKKIIPGTPEGDKLEIALLLIKKYEDENFPIPKSYL